MEGEPAAISMRCHSTLLPFVATSCGVQSPEFVPIMFANYGIFGPSR